MKRVMTIEAALQWAYCEELPKSFDGKGQLPPSIAEGSRSITEMMILGTMVDASPNAYAVMVDYSAVAEPHPDARVIGAAVQALTGSSIDLPANWDPFEDIADPAVRALAGDAAARALRELQPFDEHGVRRPRELASQLVVRQAVARCAPDWTLDAMTVRMVCNAQGGPCWFVRSAIAGPRGSTHPIEVDGWDHRLRKPKPGAYRKSYLDPDPYLCAIERANYEIWLSALACLHADLAGHLERIEVVPSPRPLRPWVTGDLVVKVLRDLTAKPAPVKKFRRRPVSA